MRGREVARAREVGAAVGMAVVREAAAERVVGEAVCYGAGRRNGRRWR